MSDKEIVINIDSKKLFSAAIALSLLIIISYSYLTALFAFDAPSEDTPLRLNQVVTLDASNNSQTSFNPGETVRINSTIEKAARYLIFRYSNMYYDFIGDTSFRIIIAIADGSKEPVYFQSTQDVISVGSIESVFFDYVISAGADSGTYTYKVMVWSGWLPSGLASSTYAWEGTFTVA
jgi:hypothetical protein